jgi:hypothetical protein
MKTTGFKVICGQCNKTMPMPANWFQGGANKLFTKHGHMPEKLTLVAPNGDQRITGQILGESPAQDEREDQTWYNAHFRKRAA